jgi:hypothetical protein
MLMTSAGHQYESLSSATQAKLLYPSQATQAKPAKSKLFVGALMENLNPIAGDLDAHPPRHD